MQSNSEKARFGFYGWWLVVICLFVVSIGFGAGVYLYSVIADAMQETYPGSRFLLMMGITGLLIAMALMSRKVGMLIDKYPIKYTLMGGSLAMGLGFILIALSTNIWQVITVYTVFIGAGAATLSGLTATTLLSRWFVRHRGLAIGIAALGSQFGGFVYPPIMAHVIETYEWRTAVASLGILISVCIPLLTYFWVVDQPAQKGLHPDGALRELTFRQDPEEIQGQLTNTKEAIEPEIENKPVPTIRLRYLLSQSNFLILALTIGVASAVSTTTIANLSLFATDLGETPERGAFLISILSIIGVASSPLVGRLCDIWNMKLISISLFICSAVAALVFMSATSYHLLLFAALLQGAAGGGIYPLWACLVGRIYDSTIYGQIMGSTTLVVFLIIAPAPLMAGWIHDVTGSYRMLFVVMLTLMVACALTISKLQLPPVNKKITGP